MINILNKIIFFIAGSSKALADTEQNQPGNTGLPSFDINPPINASGDLGSIIDGIVNLLLMVGGPIAALMYVWAGFQFLTAGGEDKKIAQAKKTIIWTTIGIAILALSKGIILVVQDFLTA